MKINKLLYVFFLSLVLAKTIQADIERAHSLFQKRGQSPRIDIELAEILVNEELNFSAVPFVKEYLASGVASTNKDKLDFIIDDIIMEVGIKQFSLFSDDVLSRVNTPMIRFIRAQKLFKKGNYDRALSEINNTISEGHSIYPFALNLEATIHSIKGNQQKAIALYEACNEVSRKMMSSSKAREINSQLEVNADYCLAGIARTYFSSGKFDDANNTYLDIQKNSPVWPEILFEEAWNSFYKKDYNRTLGKLVTYNAPIFSYYFNPETDVLRALTFMRLCLWDDAKKSVDEFYNKYNAESKGIDSLLDKYGRDYKLFYILGRNHLEGKFERDNLLAGQLGHITRDPTFQEMHRAYLRGKNEINKLKTIPGSKFRAVLASNLKSSLQTQQSLMGAYIRGRLSEFSKQMKKSFEGMSYIKLEVLANSRQDIFQDNNDRDRGDVKFLKRNEKQYFWTFNGEFWADELGDYVFSLKSECRS